MQSVCWIVILSAVSDYADGVWVDFPADFACVRFLSHSILLKVKCHYGSCLTTLPIGTSLANAQSKQQASILAVLSQCCRSVSSLSCACNRNTNAGVKCDSGIRSGRRSTGSPLSRSGQLPQPPRLLVKRFLIPTGRSELERIV